MTIKQTQSSSAWEWTERLVGSGARVISARRLVGGIVSSVHAVTLLDVTGRRHSVVVRRYIGHDRRIGGQNVRREAGVLSALETGGVPAPRLIDADPQGVRAGVPALVMSRVPGRIHLTPRNPEAWLRQMAAM